MDCPLQQYDVRVKHSIEKQLRVLLQWIRFDIAVQSTMIVIASAGSVWIDLWNNYEMRELSWRNAWQHDVRYTGKNRKCDNDEGMKKLLCEMKTAIWCWDESGVWKKQWIGGTVGELEWCLGMKERKKRNSWCERLSCVWKLVPFQVWQWWEKACLLVRIEW